MNFELENKVALVTGGSKNIGKEIALSLASEKVNIAFTYNSSENQAEETLNEIKKFGVQARAYKLDISKFNETQDVLQKIYKDFGNIDILINNAGFTKIKKFLETNIDDWNKQIDISLKGTIYCCHLVSKKMIDNQDGRIINIVGDSSRIGEANLAITAAARGGTIALGKSLAKEFGRYSITVNTISLGLVKTSHTDNDILEKNMDKILKSYPIKRLGKTSDVAPMVIFLSSKHAEWITGQTFSINGGYLSLIHI